MGKALEMRSQQAQGGRDIREYGDKIILQAALYKVSTTD